MANGYSVADIAALRAYDVTATPVIEALLVVSNGAWYQWDPAGDNVTYADNGEWLIHSTGNNGLWYTLAELTGSNLPDVTAPQPYPVKYGYVDPASLDPFVNRLFRNPGGDSSAWSDNGFAKSPDP